MLAVEAWTPAETSLAVPLRAAQMPLVQCCQAFSEAFSQPQGQPEPPLTSAATQLLHEPDRRRSSASSTDALGMPLLTPQATFAA
jgi:hypothetical protein